MTDLGTLGGAISWANGINDAGQVAGMATDSLGNEHPFRTAANQPITASDDLGSYGRIGSLAHTYAINNSGQVVGLNFDGGNESAFRTAANQSLTDTDNLGTLGGQNSAAQGINSSGQVVGGPKPPVIPTPSARHPTSPSIPLPMTSARLADQATIVRLMPLTTAGRLWGAPIAAVATLPSAQNLTSLLHPPTTSAHWWEDQPARRWALTMGDRS